MAEAAEVLRLGGTGVQISEQRVIVASDVLNIRCGVYAAVVVWIVWAGCAVDAAAVIVLVDEAAHLALKDGLV